MSGWVRRWKQRWKRGCGVQKWRQRERTLLSARWLEPRKFEKTWEEWRWGHAVVVTTAVSFWIRPLCVTSSSLISSSLPRKLGFPSWLPWRPHLVNSPWEWSLVCVYVVSGLFRVLLKHGDVAVWSILLRSPPSPPPPPGLPTPLPQHARSLRMTACGPPKALSIWRFVKEPRFSKPASSNNYVEDRRMQVCKVPRAFGWISKLSFLGDWSQN